MFKNLSVLPSVVWGFDIFYKLTLKVRIYDQPAANVQNRLGAPLFFFSFQKQTSQLQLWWQYHKFTGEKECVSRNKVTMNRTMCIYEVKETWDCVHLHYHCSQSYIYIVLFFVVFPFVFPAYLQVDIAIISKQENWLGQYTTV